MPHLRASAPLTRLGWSALLTSYALLALAAVLPQGPDALPLVALVVGCVGLLALEGDQGGPPRGLALTVAASCLALAGVMAAALPATSGALTWLWVPAAIGAALGASPQQRRSETGSTQDVAVALACCAGIAVLAVGSAGGDPLGTATVAAGGAVVLAAIRLGRVLRHARTLDEEAARAEVDELTGLRNRRGLMLDLDARLARGDALAVLLMDLDGFKHVNDTFGHAAGDRLLIEVAERLRAAVPEAGLGRLGGDELVAVVGGDDAAGLAAALAIRAALAEPVALGVGRATTQASVGIACAPQHATSAGALLRHADAAMYRAKQERTGVVAHVAMGPATSRRREALGDELRRSLVAPEQLELHFAPRLGADGQVAEVEALLAWAHPTRGRLDPAAVLAHAEEQGLVPELTRLALDQALHRLRAWAGVGLHLDLALAVSTADVLGSGTDIVADALSRADTRPGALRLELRDAPAGRGGERVMGALARLGELGVRVGLGPTATADMPLGGLGALRPDVLTVDASAPRAQVEAVVAASHALDARVLAVGAADEADLARLVALGCDLAQGPAVGRALTAAPATLWLLHRLRPAGVPVAGGAATPLGAEG